MEPPITSLLTRAIEDSPMLADAFWSSGITGSMVKISELVESLADIKRQFQTNLQNTLSLIQGVNQTGVSLFLALASKGDLAALKSTIPGVSTYKVGLANSFSSTPFDTYLKTSALAQNNWTALLIPGVEAHKVQNGTRNCPSWAKADCSISRDFGCGDFDPTDLDECRNITWVYGPT